MERTLDLGRYGCVKLVESTPYEGAHFYTFTSDRLWTPLDDSTIVECVLDVTYIWVEGREMAVRERTTAACLINLETGERYGRYHSAFYAINRALSRELGIIAPESHLREWAQMELRGLRELAQAAGGHCTWELKDAAMRYVVYGLDAMGVLTWEYRGKRSSVEGYLRGRISKEVK